MDARHRNRTDPGVRVWLVITACLMTVVLSEAGVGYGKGSASSGGPSVSALTTATPVDPSPPVADPSACADVSRWYGAARELHVLVMSVVNAQSPTQSDPIEGIDVTINALHSAVTIVSNLETPMTLAELSRLTSGLYRYQAGILDAYRDFGHRYTDDAALAYSERIRSGPEYQADLAAWSSEVSRVSQRCPGELPPVTGQTLGEMFVYDCAGVRSWCTSLADLLSDQEAADLNRDPLSLSASELRALATSLSRAAASIPELENQPAITYPFQGVIMTLVDSYALLYDEWATRAAKGNLTAADVERDESTLNPLDERYAMEEASLKLACPGAVDARL